MSKTKKLFASTASVALVAAAIVPVASAAQLNDAEKIPTWAKEAVNYLVDNGAVQGDNNGNFNPTGSLTRAQAATILSKLLKLEATGTENFNDVKEGQWFYDAVVATSPEIFAGDDKGNFNPNAKLTRQEAAKVLVSAFGLTGTTDLNNFADASKVPAWAAPFVKTAVANGVINGKGNLLAPTDTITNAEFAVMAKGAVDATAEEVGPEVTSVSATNPTNVEVKFNKAIDKETLNKSVSINNVAVDGAELYTLSEDGKTLNVRVSKLDVDKAYAIKVDGIKTVDGEEIPTFVEKVLFADSQEATIEKVTAKAGSTGKTKFVEVTFSEDVTGAAANFRVNNVSPSNVTIEKNVVTLELPAEIESGNTHELRVVELADLSGNKTNATQQFTITSDTTAPVASVSASGENTIKVEFNEAVSAVDVTNVKILKGNINVTGAAGTLSADKKSIEFTVNPLVYGENETSANLTVEVAGVKDLYENASTKSTHSVTISKDVVAPTVSGIEGIVGASTFVINFSEELEGTAGDNAKYLPTLFKDNVKLSVASAVLQADKDGKLTQVLVTTNAALVEGTYEVTLAADTVTDNSLANNKNAQVKKSFTTTTPSAQTDTVKPEVSSVVVNGDVVTVTYNEDVTASAADYRNYKLDGVTIPSESVIYFENSKRVVKIELPKGYFTADKSDAIVEITNVSDLAGNVLNKYTKLNQVVVDTKAPTLVSAKLASDASFVLEFDEAISTNVTNFAPASVIIKDANGNIVKNSDNNSITTGASVGVDGKKATITLSNATLDLNKTYTISVEAGVGLVDQAGTDNDATGNEVTPFTNVVLVDGVAPILTAANGIFADDTYTSNVIGITAPAIGTVAIAKSAFSEVPASVKLVYSDADTKTADVVVTGTVEINASQDAYTYSFASANLSSLVTGTINVNLVLVDANGNESTGLNVVADGSGFDGVGAGFETLKLVK
ncbi:S-layer homology domain-containing protein [Lysinibacillus antri]|uniref:SLH domain-containing protein n=1 Tax=Lysinibacillus antri TaxID=2498145 RepID=A0A432L9W1_9BACI|nr:S-layer homology domain-containing protein [Lysinibacillus antri]RUL49811.1 hypothetical protein EK386_14745 [Lysinibacillus antri]